MASRLANIRFIADSVGNANYPGSFRGSNPAEQRQIETIRKDFAPYLYDETPPAEIMVPPRVMDFESELLKALRGE